MTVAKLLNLRLAKSKEADLRGQNDEEGVESEALDHLYNSNRRTIATLSTFVLPISAP
jgi:hypothetical protein